MPCLSRRVRHVTGPDELRPVRPAEVPIDTPNGTVVQGTLFDA